MVRRLSQLGPDVLKIEYPVDVKYEAEPQVWAKACAAVTEDSLVPWTVLSGGGSYERFKQQLQVACQAGCSGFVAGRSIWQEAATLTGQSQLDFLQEVAIRRVTELRQVAQKYGVSWQTRLAGLPVDEDWYQKY